MKLMQMLIHKDLVPPFGCRRLYYDHSLRFSNEVEQQYGVIPTGIECLENARPGFRLSLCSGEREYEVVVSSDWVKLTLVAMHLPRRILSQGGAASQTTWDRFALVIKEWEDR